ncbi:MAG: DUF4870 domain-containing protein [Spirochaetales bacterium]|nr:DUF4870 domain-containing protein [Spirochaetales bacterium]
MAAPEKKKTSMGMEENVESGLCYVGFIVTGLIFYFSEKDSKLVRFHALQSIAYSIVAVAAWFGIWILQLIFWAIGVAVISTLLGVLLWLAIVIVWIILMVKAFMGGEKLKLPIVGDFCEKQINK